MRRRGSILANNVVIGVIATLAMVVMVVIAYNANQGLPFIPSYNIKADLPDASGLIPNNEVKVGGLRVGFIKDIETVAHQDGSYTVRLSLKLEEKVKPVYRNGRAQVRQASTLGVKYLDLQPGTQDTAVLEEGETLSQKTSAKPVELQDWVNIFDKKTRDNLRITLRGLGEGLAGRGIDLNTTLQNLPPLLENLEPVVKTLAEPDTNLEGFLVSLGAFQGQLAPVAQSLASLFVNLDTTFAALAGVTTELQQIFEKAPSALAAQTVGLRSSRPFLRRSTRLLAKLRPSIRDLRAFAPDMADAITAGKNELPRAPAFNKRVDRSLRTIEGFVEDANVPLAIDALRDTNAALNPFLAFITPAQTTCNYITLLLRNFASLSSGGNPGTARWLRTQPIVPVIGPNSLGFPSSGPANGPELGNYLHSNPYPNTAAPGQDNECEAGREWYTDKQQVIGNVPGNQGVVTEGR